MKSVTIRGTFTTEINNYVVLDVFRPNALPNPYDFRKTFTGDFTETLRDLEDNTEYTIDFTGYTSGEFRLRITGEFKEPNPITDEFENRSFSPGYTIVTNA